MFALASSLMSRKIVNAIYFLVPPVGLLFMFLSPSFSTKERMVRGLVTASFLTFFSTMGPSLHHYYDSQLAALQAQQQP
ncbi:MAG: hypothetical protein JWM80_5596 [Cyanobacteria bacterium RYN_339]|nr:hypothetical protein [Cyanobacteria bacterium RYN_339]